MVPGNVSIELVAIFVPFDGVKRFTIQVEVALEPDGVVSYHVIGDSHFSQS